MKRILLVRTHHRIFADMISPPLGLLYLASYLREKFAGRMKLEILDLGLLPRPLQKLEERVRDFEPDLVGISNLTLEAKVMHQAAGKVKEIRPGCPVVAGGPHATIMHREVLKDPNIDFAVVGEGEETFARLVDRLSGNGGPGLLPGLAYREEGQLVFPGPAPAIKNLDSLPFPAWDLLDFDAYLRYPDFNHSMGKGRYMPILSSRACPYQCVFCHSIFGKGFRKRSAGNVVQEMEELRSRYEVREFQFFDDCFNLDPDRAKAIGAGISSRLPGVRLSFPNGVRGDILDREVLQALRRAGAYSITIAVETASPRLQVLIRKNLDLEKVREAIGQAVDLGYYVHGFFMIGFPTETLEEMQKTIDFALESPLMSASFFIVVPFPGTELARLYADAGFTREMDPADYCYRADTSAYQELTGTDLKKIQKRAYRRFYRDPRRLINGLRRVPGKWGYLFSNLFRFGREFLRY